MKKITCALGIALGLPLVLPALSLADAGGMLSTPHGEKVHFVDPQGNGEILVIEESDVGGSALARVESGLGREASPSEIFWALSAPGDEIPKNMKDGQSSEKAQGWARERPDRGGLEQVNVACDNTSFQGSIAGGFLSGAPFIRLDKKPATYNAFVGTTFLPDAPPLPKPTYHYTATFNGAKKWRGKVCARQVAGTSGFPYNLTVSFEKYNAALTNWEPMTSSGGNESRWYITEGTTKVYTWAWNTNSLGNYRILIGGAEANDEFDIMADHSAD